MLALVKLLLLACHGLKNEMAFTFRPQRLWVGLTMTFEQRQNVTLILRAKSMPVTKRRVLWLHFCEIDSNFERKDGLVWPLLGWPCGKGDIMGIKLCFF